MTGRAALAGLACVAAGVVLLGRAPRRIVYLARGTVYLKTELRVEGGTELRGAAGGSVLRFAPDFAGRALIVVSGTGAVLRDFSMEGDRDADGRSGLPAYDTPFARFTRGNGILAEDAADLTIENVRARDIAGFVVLASRCRGVAIDRVTVRDSGSRNALGRNNTTGGILLEEGTSDFRVTRCDLRNIRGNGIWTHSLYTSARNSGGLIAGNHFYVVGRDAIQVGHATHVRVEDNTGSAIGFPAADMDVEGKAVPVAIDTSGNVDGSSYARNWFRQVDGKCIDLDGFHDGEVRENRCETLGNFGIVMNNTNPDMQSRNIRVVDNVIDGARYGGIFVIGTGHRITGNRLLHLNEAHCGCAYSADDPEILAGGIYLARGAERPAPARDNVVERNEIQGYQMKTRCILDAPGILPAWNTVRGNRCE